MANEHIVDNHDQQHEACFGSHVGISLSLRLKMNELKNVDSNVKEFSLDTSGASHFSDMAWELLGRYLSRHAHLKKVTITSFGCRTNMAAAAMVRGWARLSNGAMGQLGHFVLPGFDLDSIQSIIPLLEDAGRLDISITSDECFDVLMNALDGRPIHFLNVTTMNRGPILFPHLEPFHNISALEHTSLPDLATLVLSENYIGRDGSIVIANMLQRDDCRLKKLILNSAGICNEEAGIIANALKQNKSLNSLSLQNCMCDYPRNDIGEEGYKAFLTVLCDMRSIDNTYTSNHTMTSIQLHPHDEIPKKLRVSMYHIMQGINERYKDKPITSIGRMKVMETQFKRKTRKLLSRLQGVAAAEWDIDPLVLPEMYSSIGQHLDQSELYQMIITTLPDLSSIVSRKGVLEQQIDETDAQIAILMAKKSEMKKELLLIKSKEHLVQPLPADGEQSQSVKRIRRSAY